MSAEPKINDQFWFDMSADMVKDSVKRIKEGAGKLETLLAWAVPIYTGSAVFTVEFKNIASLWILLILSLPFLFLLIAYWYAHIAQMPSSVAFDPRSPTLIEKAYTNAFRKSKLNLGIAKGLSFIGLLSLSIALMLAFVLKNQAHDEIYLRAKVDKAGRVLLVTGYFPADSELMYQLISRYKKDSTTTKTSAFLNSRNGIFYQSFPIDTEAHSFSIEIQWRDKEYTRRIIKYVTKQ